jgi:hypothetical protein
MLVYQRVNPNISQNPMLRPKPRMTCWMSPNGCGRQVGTNINQHQLLECRSACCWCAKLLDHLPTGYLPPVAGSQCCTFTWGPLRKNVGGKPESNALWSCYSRNLQFLECTPNKETKRNEISSKRCAIHTFLDEGCHMWNRVQVWRIMAHL